MKTKSKQLQPDDPLEELKLAWEQHKEYVRNLPFLTDEQLQRLFEAYCASHDGVPPLARKRRRPLVWTRVLSAALCLCVAVCSIVLCGRLGDDRPVRVMLCAIAVASLLLVVYSLYPYIEPPYRRFCRECEDGRRPFASFGIGHVVSVGMAFVVVLVFAALMPIGDGFHIVTVGGGSRLASINSVGYIMAQVV